MALNFKYLSYFAKNLFEFKTSPNQDNNFEQKRTDALIAYTAFKEFTRSKRLKVHSNREQLQEEKQLVDTNRLRLQNLLYEVNHLRREIRFCNKFKSGDEDIQLLKEEEYATHLNIVSNKNKPKSDRHKLLELELKLRKHLHAHLKELLETRANNVKAIKLKVQRLASFNPSLDALLVATTPLQDSLKIHFDTECRSQQLALLLPKPLYFLHQNIRAFQVANGKDLQIAIKYSHNAQDNEGDMSNIQQKIREITQEDYENLQPFPLMIQITIGEKDKISLTLTTLYFPKLQLATAFCELYINQVALKQSESNQSISLTNGILEQVSEVDVGKVVPVSTQYVLKNIQMSPDECLQHLKNSGYGKPFAWLQKMCHLESSEGLDRESTFKTIWQTTSHILKRLEYLWDCRLNLLQQIEALENKNVDSNLREEKLPSIQILCNFTEWSPILWDEVISSDLILTYFQRGIINERNVFYKAVLVRDFAKMQCLLTISPNFPLESPVWILEILYDGHQNALNNSAVKRIEQIANSINEDYLENKMSLISYQLQFIMFGFDTFLETEELASDFCNNHQEAQKLLMRFFNRQRFRPLTQQRFKATNIFIE